MGTREGRARQDSAEEIIDFGGLDHSGRPRIHTKRRGAKRPAFWRGFWGPGGRPDPKIDDFSLYCYEVGGMRIRPEIFDFESDLGQKLGQTKPKISGTVPTHRHTTILNDSGPILACFDDDPKLCKL